MVNYRFVTHPEVTLTFVSTGSGFDYLYRLPNGAYVKHHALQELLDAGLIERAPGPIKLEVPRELAEAVADGYEGALESLATMVREAMGQ